MTTKAQTSSNAVTEYVVDSGGDGIVIANATTQKLAFYGSTPVVQQTGTSGSPVTTLATSSASAMWGFQTSTQANQIINAMAALQKLGLIS